jgi:hypothetical protein
MSCGGRLNPLQGKANLLIPLRVIMQQAAQYTGLTARLEEEFAR